MFGKLLLRTNQLYSAVLFFVSWIISWFYPKQDNLWLIGERNTEARDNGYWMFRFLMEHHPELNVRYIIKKSSPDFQKLLPWKDRVVEASSFMHYILMWKAKYGVSTHFHTYFPYRVNHQLFVNCLKRINRKCRLVWLQHGITINDHPSLHENSINVDVLICGAKPEYDFIMQVFRFPPNIIYYTGLARFDNLHDIPINKQQILVMPTWRSWLNEDNFAESEYYIAYSQLLQNVTLHHILEQSKMHLVFYPHFKCQRFIKLFSDLELPSSIVVADSEHFDVQQLLKESALLITDYSSVAWDAAYMKKPHIYFQFDEQTFRKGHYPQGYYDYHHGLGEWTSTLEDLIAAIEKYIQNDMRSSSECLERHATYFPLYDTYNCQRIFDVIQKLK